MRLKLEVHRLAIDRFQEPGPERAMHANGAADRFRHRAFRLGRQRRRQPHAVRLVKDEFRDLRDRRDLRGSSALLSLKVRTRTSTPIRLDRDLAVAIGAVDPRRRWPRGGAGPPARGGRRCCRGRS